MTDSMNQRLHNIFEITDRQDRLTRLVNGFIITLILLNVAALMLESVASIRQQFLLFFQYFEIFSVGVFTIEYLLRLWASSKGNGLTALKARVRHAFRPMMIIDLVAILPSYLFFLGLDGRMLRALRLLRLIRIIKLERYTHSISLITRVMVKKRSELIATCFILFVLLLITSSLMYYVENEAQPDKFTSIPATMRWGIATLTTVGYGDMVPITPMGRMLGAFSAVIGIALFALPTGILASGFSEELGKSKGKNAYCPHCGKEL